MDHVRSFARRHRAWFLSAALLAAGAGFSSPMAQNAPANTEAAADLNQAIAKSNAYIDLMNRTARAVQSWDRYLSWVKSPKGPTGRERIVYGLYGLYDVRGQIEKANAVLGKAPQSPGLDAAVTRYIAAYQELAPIITEAEGYYERKDYLTDRMEGGKDLHLRLKPAAESFMAERRKLEAAMRAFKTDLDSRELASIEAREGRKAAWHVKNVMMAAQDMVELMPTSAKPVVDLPVFDAALTTYAAAVKEMDAYSAQNPNQFSTFESMPRSWLGKLREFRQKLGRSRGDARRGAGFDLTWIINEYNMMISSAQSARRFGS